MVTSENSPFRAPISEHPWEQKNEGWITTLCIGFTLAACAFTLIDQVAVARGEYERGEVKELAGHLAFLAVATLLVYGGLVYQITRLFYILRRRRKGETVNRSVRDLDCVTVLIPSYNEERETMFQTMLSAALQEGVQKRVVLLIDNPPAPDGRDPLLDEARAMSAHIRTLIAPMNARLNHLHSTAAVGDASALAQAFDECAEWFAQQAAEVLNAKPASSHTDRFFALEVLIDRAEWAWERARFWRAQAAHGVEWMERDWSHVLSWFNADVETFERKQFENLSHAPNKAANLNGYIGLMGKRWTRVDNEGKVQLLEAEPSDPDSFEVPDTPFVLTLDADSLLLAHYAEELIAQLHQPEHARCAIIQTPYSAIPGAPGVLERIAGATTDVQYIIHQGFTAWDGTYWVGANALIRKQALLDIAEGFEERGHSMTRFIQDRTVIEDTESTIDLLNSGWTLWNYPARRAYSATPSDFGALLIQRRRWANGGLLILPKAVKHLAHEGSPLNRLKEGFMRVHYLVSIAAVNIGLLVLLAFPMTESVTSFWLPLTAVPYFFLYARDLRLMRYKKWDVVRVYALNLLLIPVHIGGVLKSLQQRFTGKKIPFSRTPKVEDRTPADWRYILATFGLIAQWSIGAYWDFRHGYASHGFFAGLNALILAYAVSAFMGWRNSFKDLNPKR